MTWPHTETPLTDTEKRAYRYLLYQAMLDTRNLCQPRSSESKNPVVWWRQYRQSRIAGEIADWLHNLALYSCRDFKGFSADWFWKEYEGVSRRVDLNTTCGNLDYRRRFDEEITRLNGRNDKA